MSDTLAWSDSLCNKNKSHKSLDSRYSIRIMALIDNATRRESEMTKFQAGDKVFFNGDFEGIVLGYYTAGMIEVRGQRGVVCIPECDARLR